MVVTTATTGASSRKLRSLSSASTTKYSPLPSARGGAGLIDAAADDERGIEMRGGQNGRDDGGGGGFAVRAGDGDAVFQAHQFGQHFRARDDRNFRLVRFDDFGIVWMQWRRK